MKTILLICTLLVLQISCSNPSDRYMKNHKVILYNTDEFKKFEANSDIKLKEAWDLQKKFAQKRNKSPKNWLFFVIDGHYLFTSIVQPKIPEASVGGVWINSKTGEVKEVKSHIMLYYKDVYNGDGESFF